MLVALPELAFAQLTSKLKSNELNLLSRSCKNLHNDLKELMREVRAVATISGFWKWYGPFMSTREVISRFKAAMLSGEQLRPLEFYTVVQHLRKFTTRRVAGFLFARLIMVCIGLCPETKKTFPRERPRTRNMLTAYMSSYFPDNVFEQFAENENAVRGKAALGSRRNIPKVLRGALFVCPVSTRTLLETGSADASLREKPLRLVAARLGPHHRADQKCSCAARDRGAQPPIGNCCR